MSKKRPEDQTMCLGDPGAPPSVDSRMVVIPADDDTLEGDAVWLEPGDPGYDEAGENRSLIPEDEAGDEAGDEGKP